MIPKTVHYCWFGNSSMPKLLKTCLSSWNKQLEGWEIKCWNEDNFYKTDNLFYKRAHAAGDWAFVSDFVRLKVLYDFGGIYLDTDMLLLKSLNDFLHLDCFLGLENEDTISAGIIGATPKSEFIKRCLEYYETFDYSRENRESIPKVITDVYNQMLLQGADLSKVTIYSKDFFYAFPYGAALDLDYRYKKYLTKNSYAIHLWHQSWMKKGIVELQYLERKKYLLATKIFIKRMLNEEKVRPGYFKDLLRTLAKSLK